MGIDDKKSAYEAPRMKSDSLPKYEKPSMKSERVGMVYGMPMTTPTPGPAPVCNGMPGMTLKTAPCVDAYS